MIKNLASQRISVKIWKWLHPAMPKHLFFSKIRGMYQSCDTRWQMRIVSGLSPTRSACFEDNWCKHYQHMYWLSMCYKNYLNKGGLLKPLMIIADAMPQHALVCYPLNICNRNIAYVTPKIMYFYYQKICSQDQSIQKNNSLILKKEALVLP